ncbi:MAG: hypothetical protein LBH81_01235 [Rickettsiales bacterium]|jgi:hypothetical protein|nr:hypothetical protein [Rickettsiales bacterium]
MTKTYRDMDLKNIAAIETAAKQKLINSETREYLERLYGDGLHWFREIFYTMGKYLGAPKTPVYVYDTLTQCRAGEPVHLADINPKNSYIVHYSMESDPASNQFFTFNACHDAELSLTSAITVLVGSQKMVGRALEKFTQKERVQDVYRMKCLFDIIPQARAFVDGLIMMMPEKILLIKDNFYNTDNERNYRDLKVILNIGTDEAPVPLEIICQTRTFFEFECWSHKLYAEERSKGEGRIDYIHHRIAELHESGIRNYNHKVLNCMRQLFNRVGWNVMSGSGGKIRESLLAGFPRVSVKFYPEDAMKTVLDKVRELVSDGDLSLENTPRKLTRAEELEVFDYMTRFVMSAALPYSAGTDNAMTGKDPAAKLFNVVMSNLTPPPQPAGE